MRLYVEEMRDVVLGHLVPREDATFHCEPVTR